jgi:hypothetical protein
MLEVHAINAGHRRWHREDRRPSRQPAQGRRGLDSAVAPPNSLSQTTIFRAQLAPLYIADDLPAPVPTDSSAMAVPVITRVAAAAKMRCRMIES